MHYYRLEALHAEFMWGLQTLFRLFASFTDYVFLQSGKCHSGSFVNLIWNDSWAMNFIILFFYIQAIIILLMIFEFYSELRSALWSLFQYELEWIIDHPSDV